MLQLKTITNCAFVVNNAIPEWRIRGCQTNSELRIGCCKLRFRITPWPLRGTLPNNNSPVATDAPEFFLPVGKHVIELRASGRQ